jgi:cytochrome c553
MSMRTLISLAAVAAIVSVPAAAADIEAGKKKVQEVCAACHGIDGAAPIMPEYPKLSGQYPDYLAKALRDYKSGARKNPTMGAQVGSLGAQDLADLAAFYSIQEGSLRVIR